MSKILDIAGAYVGITEITGAQNNPKIVEMFKKSGAAWVDDDETPWCAAFVGAVLDDAGIKGTMKLNARSYLEWGESVDIPQPGDVAVLWRERRDGWKGHVGFYVRHDSMGDVVLIGGNQGDSVSVKAYDPDRVLEYGFRRLIVKKRPAAPPAWPMLGAMAATIALFWEQVKEFFNGII